MSEGVRERGGERCGEKEREERLCSSKISTEVCRTKSLPNERRPHTSQSHTSAEIGIAHSAFFSFCVSILGILGSLRAVGFGMQPPQPFPKQNKTKKLYNI